MPPPHWDPLLTYITEAFLSHCMTDRKTKVHRSEHLGADKFVCFIPILVYIYVNFKNSSTTFSVCKKEWKSNALSAVCIIFYIQPSSLLLSFSPMPPSNFPTPRPLHVIITQSLNECSYIWYRHGKTLRLNFRPSKITPSLNITARMSWSTPSSTSEWSLTRA